MPSTLEVNRLRLLRRLTGNARPPTLVGAELGLQLDAAGGGLADVAQRATQRGVGDQLTVSSRVWVRIRSLMRRVKKIDAEQAALARYFS